MNSNPFNEKIVWITGGSSGIGLATAKQLAAAGAHVWIIARRREQLDLALKEIEAARLSPQQKCGAIQADVSDAVQATDAVGQATNALGLPHWVINSAGVVQPGYFKELGLDLFHWMMDINYFGAVNICRAVVPGMIERGSGYIVNISSMGGIIGGFGYSAYSGSKFALTGFTDVLRAELKHHGVQVSIVFPPDVDTPQLAYEDPFKPPETRALAGTMHPMSPDKVAEIILKKALRGQYRIFPSFDSWLIYALFTYTGGLGFKIYDWIVADARRKIQKQTR